MIGLLLLLLAGLVTAIALTTVMLIHRLTHPPRKTYAWAVSRSKPGTPAELSPPRAFEPTLLRLNSSELPAWRIPGDDPTGPLIIHTPGWGDSRLGVLPRLHALTPHASHVITWDPPGLGEAEGTCHLGVLEPHLLAQLIEQELEADPTLTDRGIVLFGSSLGAGVSIVTAAASSTDATTGTSRFAVRLSDRARQTLASPRSAVIAEAPYREAPTPARNVMKLSALPFAINGPIAFALLAIILQDRPAKALAAITKGWRGYDRARHAKNLRCPLLVLHPEHDEVSPLEDGKAIANAAPNAKLAVIHQGAHNTLWTDETTREATTTAVTDFLRSLRAPKP